MVGSIAAARRPVPAARTSLLVETNSLFLMTGNLPLPLWKGLGILDLIRPGESDFGRFPCIFPAHQGSRPRDEFAPDCLHRQVVRDFGDSATGAPSDGEFSRHSAGFWTSAQAIPDRRPRWCGSSRAPAERFLRGRVGRSGSRRSRRLPRTDWGFRGFRLGVVRPIYFAVLISHVLLSVVTFPMILTSFYLGLSNRLAAHRRLSKWTWAGWMYVAVTGVVVYSMLHVIRW